MDPCTFRTGLALPCLRMLQEHRARCALPSHPAPTPLLTPALCHCSHLALNFPTGWPEFTTSHQAPCHKEDSPGFPSCCHHCRLPFSNSKQPSIL